MNAPIAPPQQNTSNAPDDGGEQANPFDSILARIDSYIQDPKQVTPQTLADLKAEVMAVQADVEGGDEPTAPAAPAPAQGGSLAAKIKSLAVAMLLALAFAGSAHAEKRFAIQASTNSAPIPQWKEFVSEAVYYSSATCAGTSSTNLGISTGPALLFAVQITSAGNNGAIATIFDSPAVQTFGNPSARLISGPIDTSKVGQFTFNVPTSSGIWLNSAGTPPPCLNILYTER